jgi:hypothetical protein
VDWKLGQTRTPSSLHLESQSVPCKSDQRAGARKRGIVYYSHVVYPQVTTRKNLTTTALEAGLNLAKQQHAKLSQTRSQFPWSSRRSTNQTPIRLSSPQSTQFFGYRNWHPEHPILGRCGTYTGDGSELYPSSTDFSHVSKSLLPDRADWIGAWSAGVSRQFDHRKQLRGVKRFNEMR